jgi:hypothetical protein
MQKVPDKGLPCPEEQPQKSAPVTQETREQDGSPAQSSRRFNWKSECPEPRGRPQLTDPTLDMWLRNALTWVKFFCVSEKSPAFLPTKNAAPKGGAESWKGT